MSGHAGNIAAQIHGAGIITTIRLLPRRASRIGRHNAMRAAESMTYTLIPPHAVRAADDDRHAKDDAMYKKMQKGAMHAVAYVYPHLPHPTDPLTFIEK